MRRIRFHRLARIDLERAAKHYEDQRDGLGNEFIASIQATIRSIAASPNAGSPLSQGLRRRLVRRFPFGILYKVEGQTILVLAAAHLHRKPGFWKGRVREV